MAGYVVTPDSGFPPVPITEIDDNLTFDYVSMIELSMVDGGTSANPKTLWSAQGGYINCYNSGADYVCPYQRMSGSSVTGDGTRFPTAGQSIYMCGVKFNLTDAGISRLYVFFTEANSQSDAVSRLNHTHQTDQILYDNLWENAENQGIIADEREWDETPTENADDPNNLLPNGGAFADIGAFDETFLQDILPDPEDMEPVDTGGVICCYSLDHSDMILLNQCLFYADFWQTLANRFSGLSDPLSMILQCVELPLIPSRGSVAVAKLGGIEIMTPAEGGSSHSISLPCPATRYGRYYIGNLINKEVWGSEKDYSATSVSIYLPYVGVKELDVDVVMDNVLELYLYVDYWTGDILYLLRISNSIRPAKYYTQTSVIYRWTGNCARAVPLGRIDNTGPILHAASAIGSAFAGFIGGASVGTVAASSGLDIEADTTQIQTGAPNVPKNLNGFINGFTPTIQTSGNIAGNVGSMDYQYPYLIIKRGVPEYPNGWRGEMGAPRNQMLTISSLSGYTLFSTVYLENIECMAEEKAELERLLTTEGVIL